MENIDWKNLGFKYIDTGAFVTVEYHNGSWGKPQKSTNPNINLHVASTCLHYGQACFEGQKAFSRKDGSIAIFRPEENAKRMADSARRLVMEPVPTDLFIESMKMAVEINKDYVPPYGTGASLYLRPLLIGITPRVGVNPSEDYLFAILAMPVGPYYKDGFYPVKAYVQENYDRAAPRGVGHIKAAGNYAAGLAGDRDGKSKGFPICLYLDAETHSFVDEFGTSNFFAITSDKKYITPDSYSILPSITNMSLQDIAKDYGYTVEKRPVAISEIESFDEIGACGTAAVITPIYSITYGDKVFTYGTPDKAGDTLTKFFNEIQGIQYGDLEDKHKWMITI